MTLKPLQGFENVFIIVTVSTATVMGWSALVLWH